MLTAQADDDPPQPLGPAQLLHPITMAPPQPSSAHELGMEEYQWRSSLAQSYPYHSPLPLELDAGPSLSVSAPGDMGLGDMSTVQYTEVMGMASMGTTERTQTRTTSPPRLLEETMTHRFPTTLPPPPDPLAPPRLSPPQQQQQQQQQHTHSGTRPRPSPILVNVPTRDQTTMSEEEMYAHLAAAAAQLPGTSTGQSPGPSLDGSPSWSSAMTPTMSQQLGQLFPYQALQRQHSVVSAPGMPGMPAGRGQLRRQDSLRVPLSSPSSIGIGHRHPSSPGHPPPSPRTQTSMGGYTQDLVRQQKEQMLQYMQQQQQQQAAEEQEREQEYYLSMGMVDIAASQQQQQQQHHQQQQHALPPPLPLSPQGQPPHLQQYYQPPPHPPPQGYGVRQHSAESLAQALGGMDGAMYQQQQQQQGLHAQVQMVGAAYPHGPLDLDLQAAGQQAGMVKFESP